MLGLQPQPLPRLACPSLAFCPRFQLIRLKAWQVEDEEQEVCGNISSPSRIPPRGPVFFLISSLLFISHFRLILQEGKEMQVSGGKGQRGSQSSQFSAVQSRVLPGICLEHTCTRTRTQMGRGYRRKKPTKSSIVDKGEQGGFWDVVGAGLTV